MLVELRLVEQRYQAVLEVLNDSATVTDVARRYGVARQTVHAWLRAYAGEGMAGLVDRSSRPARCPHQMSPAVEARIIAMRTAHPTWGSRTILYWLAHDGVNPVPGRTSVDRCLTRHGLVTATPRRRKRSDYRRWERSAAMELWQMDVVGGVRLAGGGEAKIVSGIDDHSRFVVSAHVVARATAGPVCEALQLAVDRYGPPAAILTDNGKGLPAGMDTEVTSPTPGTMTLTELADHLSVTPQALYDLRSYGPRTAIGSFGEIAVTDLGGRYRARTPLPRPGRPAAQGDRRRGHAASGPGPAQGHLAPGPAQAPGPRPDPGAGSGPALCRRVLAHRTGSEGPRPDGKVRDICEVLLGTAVRPGVVLAPRPRDVTETTAGMVIHVQGTVVRRAGVADFRQDHPTTRASNRRLAVPAFAAQVLRRRIATMGAGEQEVTIFHDRDGRVITPHNLRRTFRDFVKHAGVDGLGIAPRWYRCTGAVFAPGARPRRRSGPSRVRQHRCDPRAPCGRRPHRGPCAGPRARPDTAVRPSRRSTAAVTGRRQRGDLLAQIDQADGGQANCGVV